MKGLPFIPPTTRSEEESGNGVDESIPQINYVSLIAPGDLSSLLPPFLYKLSSTSSYCETYCNPISTSVMPVLSSISSSTSLLSTSNPIGKDTISLTAGFAVLFQTPHSHIRQLLGQSLFQSRHEGSLGDPSHYFRSSGGRKRGSDIIKL
ncbi:hypothetical protein AVEN_168132-1 [Araneus ventricosus]|uniref:Uncharacterized protein n=1 Tax=Araneus ventricosus TaxID=182803 RepID=A0A4Y2LAB2_ARAVE|nr:hypothetical protein AVEN_168132-1 [Araneus ventricosus]